MTLLDFFDQIEQTYIGVFIRDSSWLFPVIESIHLVGLALLGGSILVLDFRLLGTLLTSFPIKLIERNCRLWFLLGINIMILTGVPLFISEAIKCYYNPFFWIKMSALITILIFTFTIKSRIIADSSNTESSLTIKATGLFSMLCWFIVAASGRWIGFY